MIWLLVVTVLALDTLAILMWCYAVGLVDRAHAERDAYRVVAKLALAELSDTRDLLVAMVEDSGAEVGGTSAIDRKWD